MATFSAYTKDGSLRWSVSDASLENSACCYAGGGMFYVNGPNFLTQWRIGDKSIQQVAPSVLRNSSTSDGFAVTTTSYFNGAEEDDGFTSANLYTMVYDSSLIAPWGRTLQYCTVSGGAARVSWSYASVGNTGLPSGICWDGTYLVTYRAQVGLPSVYTFQRFLIQDQTTVLVKSYTTSYTTVEDLCYDGSYFWVIDRGGTSARQFTGEFVEVDSFTIPANSQGIMTDGVFIYVISA